MTYGNSKLSYTALALISAIGIVLSVDLYVQSRLQSLQCELARFPMS